ncbi:unnamed protein product [Paramecium sonneborni]|uniref:Uncharacterized protein n=1 Tax=Paramecium sonneborni TaxID=65129 RepID=A0A8S1LHE4_9CILI|nr:unnamed protein product [Paramecium sonneborni]
MIRNQKCIEVTQINNYAFCQYPIDEGCQYDYSSKTCQIVSQFDDLSCSKGINRIACLQLTKKNLQCQFVDYCFGPKNIAFDPLIIYETSNLLFINSNTCNLVNNGDIVKYDTNLKICVKVNDLNSISCITEGLNKDGCLSIKSQNCIWDLTTRKCREIKFDVKDDSCEQQNWSSHLCSQINLDKPCGFIKDGCNFIDIQQARCTQEGLNKFACLNIQKYPCIWIKNLNDENYHCEDYIPHLSCNQIPQNVNSKVCSMVKEGACYYNLQKLQCEVPNKNETNCELMGLNIIGCVQIEMCFFDQKCQLLNRNNYKCDDFPIANKLICKNAIDSCKYNEIVYGCSYAYDELCSNDSLSMIACQNQKHCSYLDNNCQCKQYIDNYHCNYITNIERCQEQSHCIFLNIPSNSEIDIQYNHKCRQKTCQDLKAEKCDNNKILGITCYWNNSEQCQSASKCEDIIHSTYECSQYQFNGRPCQMINKKGFCEQFSCEKFSQQLCSENSQFCKFEESCKTKQCIDYNDKNCILNDCDWNKNDGICQQQVECSQIKNEFDCIRQKFNKRACFWVIQNDTEFCTSHGCRNLNKSLLCSGQRLIQESCVELNDSTCLSCEEILDKCECIQQSKYCYYDIKQNNCNSRNCESFKNQEECPVNFCRYQDEKCQAQCQYIYDEDQCKKIKECSWLKKKQKCQVQCEIQTDELQCKNLNECFWNNNQLNCENKILILIQDIKSLLLSLVLIQWIYI